MASCRRRVCVPCPLRSRPEGHLSSTMLAGSREGSRWLGQPAAEQQQRITCLVYRTNHARRIESGVFRKRVSSCRCSHAVDVNVRSPSHRGAARRLIRPAAGGTDMDSTNALVRVVDQPALDAIAVPLSDAVKSVYSRAGDAGQTAKNALHGVWLGPPLHPVFTDVPLGAWTTGLVLDAVGAIREDEGLERAADVAMAVGLVGAAGAAVTGLTDWSETDGAPRRTGLLHGL